VYDLFCIAGSSLDLILTLPRLPEPDEKLLAQFAGRAAGGLVANAACAASRLGLRTGWSGLIGDDDGGRFVLGEFATYGVDASRAQILPGSAGDFCIILLDDSGERTILVVNSLPEPPPLDEATLDALCHCRVGYALPRPLAWFEQFAGAVHAGGGLVAVDMESTALAHGAELEASLRLTDLVFTNRSGLGMFASDLSFEDAAAHLLELGVQEVVVTLGAAGSALFTTAGRLDAPGFRVPVVDTTGSGDCFHSAYLAARQAGLQGVERLRFANAAAALKVQQLGARGGLPTFAEVENFLAQHG